MSTQLSNINSANHQPSPERSLAQIIAFAKRAEAKTAELSTPGDNAQTKMERHSKKAGELVQLIRQGAYNELIKWVRSYSDDPAELAEIANIARFRLNCVELAIPYTTVSMGQPIPNGKRADIVMFMIRFLSVNRVLCIPSNPFYQIQVYGPPRGGSGCLAVPLPEDPRLLLNQIGRIASLNHFVPPPPLAAR